MNSSLHSLSFLHFPEDIGEHCGLKNTPVLKAARHQTKRVGVDEFPRRRWVREEREDVGLAQVVDADGMKWRWMTLMMGRMMKQDRCWRGGGGGPEGEDDDGRRSKAGSELERPMPTPRPHHAVSDNASLPLSSALLCLMEWSTGTPSAVDRCGSEGRSIRSAVTVTILSAPCLWPLVLAALFGGGRSVQP